MKKTTSLLRYVLERLLPAILLLLVCGAAVTAEDYTDGHYSREELAQMLAPIAL